MGGRYFAPLFERIDRFPVLLLLAHGAGGGGGCQFTARWCAPSRCRLPPLKLCTRSSSSPLSSENESLSPLLPEKLSLPSENESPPLRES